MKNITFYTLLMITVCLSACGTKVARVSIPIKVQSEIDIGTYSNFAVLPFLPTVRVGESEKTSAKIGEVPVEIGSEIAEIIRSSLVRQKHFEVTDKEETNRGYRHSQINSRQSGSAGSEKGEIVEEKWLDDIAHLSELGQYFEVKGLIVGSYRFYTDTRPRRYYGERYSYNQQRYVMDYQDYMQKTYLLALRIMIIDVDTQKIIRDETYRQSTIEAHTIGSFVFSHMAPKETTLRELSKRAIAEFTRDISPHYEREDRFLMR